MRQIIITLLSFFMALNLVLVSFSVAEAKKGANYPNGNANGYPNQNSNKNNNEEKKNQNQTSNNSSLNYEDKKEQVSLEVFDVYVSTNTCELVSGSFKVKNTSENSTSTTGVFAVLQAHVPPSRGGQPHFFEIKKTQISDFSLSFGDIKTISYSITGFFIPQNTNSIRVEIQVSIPERDKVFISRSDSTKPCTPPSGGSQPPQPPEQPKPSEPPVSVQPFVTAPPPQVLSPTVLGAITQQPVTGSNLVLLGLFYLVILLLGIILRCISTKISHKAS